MMDIKKIRGSLFFPEQYIYSRKSAEKLRGLLDNGYVAALGCVNGGQAVQCAKAGLKSIYLSGWQTAAEFNLSGETYPDQNLYPSNSVPFVAKRINKALQRADQIECVENGTPTTDYFLPIVADAEAGWGGKLNTYEVVRQMIEAGVGGTHLEDQLSSAKRCGHLGGKVLVPASEHIEKLRAIKLAAEVCDVDLVIIARTDANSAEYLTSDIDEEDSKFIIGKRTLEGFYRIKNGLEIAINRGWAYAPYCDLIWCETSKPDLVEAKEFADAIHQKFPAKKLAYNCSPSFNYSKMDKNILFEFQMRLSEMGYKFQFVTLAGFHAMNCSMFEMAINYKEKGMLAYSEYQNHEFDLQKEGYTAVKHQREVGVGYFDKISEMISGSGVALKGSTEDEQFKH
jgi:isocitrate lyase